MVVTPAFIPHAVEKSWGRPGNVVSLQVTYALPSSYHLTKWKCACYSVIEQRMHYLDYVAAAAECINE